MEPAFAPSLALATRTARLALRPLLTRPRARRLPRPRPPRRVACTTAHPAPRVSALTATSPAGKRMTSNDIRKAFLSFYAARAHSVVPSASLVPDDPTIMLTIAGMVPFKPVFMGAVSRPEVPRATSSQKCVRTNDIENVGVTKRHHTFFEMLGNFSFGDYFKKDAIRWAWQLLTEVYEIPPDRLAVSVYERDDEALAIWRDDVGIPEARIQRLGDEDNFWASGPTGPCGPCSEIYFDFEPASDAPVDLQDDVRFIELYNLVFMQYSRDVGGNLTPLAAKNIDTGMGLERMAQVLQRVDNNYETDLILPIMQTVAALADTTFETAAEKEKTSLKVVGDHLRAVSHLIADGVRPSNVGRGYIVRRLIRRVVRHARLLGIEGPFTADVLPVVAELASDAGLPGVHDKLAEVTTEIEREEVRFLATLERGEDCLADVLADMKAAKKEVVSGEDAFELYDTFGFPLELTEEIAAENGFTVDTDAFEVCMMEQRNRARAARESGALNVGSNALLAAAAAAAGPTSFEGYSTTSLDGSTVTALVVEGADGNADEARQGDRVSVLLRQSPFYAEGGGQVGDTGILRAPGGVVRVSDTRREGGAYVHVGEVVDGLVRVGDVVHASVDATGRRRIMAHHTATHLLQAALKQVIPESGISQAGSLVDADRLRFDFNCPRAVTQDELQDVENMINGWIANAHDTEVAVMSLDDAKKAGAVAMFGEKYDATEVRVVDIPGVSMELCGGTHVQNTADIGLFKIVSEAGPSSGVRRIEAICGAAVMPYLTVRDAAVRQLTTSLKARPEELAARVSTLQEDLRARSKELEVARAELAVAKAMSLVNKAESVGNNSFIVAQLEGTVSSDSLKAAVESLGNSLGETGVVMLACENSGKVSFAASVGKKAQKQGILAGKLVGSVAKLCGGGGGGRPNFAQAGGRDATKLGAALDMGAELIRESFSS